MCITRLRYYRHFEAGGPSKALMLEKIKTFSGSWAALKPHTDECW